MNDDPSESEPEIDRLILAGEKLFRKARRITEKYENAGKENPSPLKEPLDAGPAPEAE
jgi:hypothetical protein